MTFINPASIRRLSKRNRRPRQSERGIIMLAAIGFLAALAVAVIVSMRLLTGESDIQSQQQKERIAFYAAEAGLAEARAMIRDLWDPAEGFSLVFARLTNESADAAALLNPAADQDPYGMGGGCNDPGPSGLAVIPCLYRLSPRQDYHLRQDGEKAFDGIDSNLEPFYPEQENVSFETFIYDDADGDNTFIQDSNRQFWVVSVGEVAGRDGERPTRVTLRALLTGPDSLRSDGSYSAQKGGGASKLSNF